MPAEITMPQLSDTMSEGTLVKWRKNEGEKVKSGDVIAEIETDKATMEMEAYESGTLAHIAVPEGQKVTVGAVVAILATGNENAAEVKKKYGASSGGGAAAPKAQQAAQSAHASAASGGSVATLEQAVSSEVHEPDEVGHGATRSAPTAVPPIKHDGNGNGNGQSGGRTRISPLARRIAADRGVDISLLQGSGPGGRIIQRDVLAAADKPAAAKPAAGPTPVAAPTPKPVVPGSKEIIALTKMRSVIAARLQQSKQQVPHFYETVDVDVEELSALRVRLNEQLESQKVRLSIGDFIAKAVATALVRHPAINSTFDGQKMEITRHGSVNLGMAVALPDGLIVPVLRGVEQLGLKEIRTRSADLVDRARKQRLKQDEMSGGTFSVSNLGTYGVREFSAIINPPEVGILAIAAAEKRAVVRKDAIVARTMMTLTLSVDHRAVDGAGAAEFLRTLKQLLEEPAMMLV